MHLQSFVFKPVEVKSTVSDQEWLNRCAEPYLNNHNVIRWSYNETLKVFDGFTIFDDAGIVGSVSLASRSEVK